MKPIISTGTKDTILTSEITWNHLIVAVIQGEPCILGRGYNEVDSNIPFFVLKNNCGSKCITTGNGYPRSPKEDTPQKMVEFFIKQGEKVAVFHQDDWRDALTWLLENTPKP